jgi:hypothetical protein
MPTIHELDDVEGLLDVLRDVPQRFPSIDALRNYLGPEFELHYEEALRRDPELRKGPIR